MKDKVQQLRTFLTALFWFNLFVLTTALLLVLYSKGPDFGANVVGSSVTFERYSIIATLAAIPLALKIFHSQYEKIKGSDVNVFSKKYLQAYLLRIAILDVAIVINIIGFYRFEAINFVYMTIITLFATFFCYPNRSAFNYKSDINENINNE